MALNYNSMNPQASAAATAANEARARSAMRQTAAGPSGIAPGDGQPVADVRAAQGVAAQAATQTAKLATDQFAQGSAMAHQQAGVGLGAADLGASEQEADRRMRLNERRMYFDRQLSTMGRDVDRQAFNSELRFKKDEAGRASLNNQQLADWAVVSAQSREDYLGKQQQVQLAHERQMALLQTAEQRIMQTLKMEEDGKIQQMDEGTKQELLYAKVTLEQKIAAEQSAHADRIAMWTMGGTLVGGAAGAFGGPAGAAAGAAAGGGLGAVAGSQVEKG